MPHSIAQEARRLHSSPWPHSTWLYLVAISIDPHCLAALCFVIVISCLGFCFWTRVNSQKPNPASKQLLYASPLPPTAMTVGSLCLGVSSLFEIPPLIPIGIIFCGVGAAGNVNQWGDILGNQTREEAILSTIRSAIVSGLLCGVLALTGPTTGLIASAFISASLPTIQRRAAVTLLRPSPSAITKLSLRRLPLWASAIFILANACSGAWLLREALPHVAAKTAFLSAAFVLSALAACIPYICVMRYSKFRFSLVATFLFGLTGTALIAWSVFDAVQIASCLCTCALVLSDAFTWFGVANQTHFVNRPFNETAVYNRFIVPLAIAAAWLLGRLGVGVNYTSSPIAILAVALIMGWHLGVREPLALKTLTISGKVQRDLEDVDRIKERCAIVAEANGLTQRETKVIELACLGYTRDRTAEELKVSTHTVRGHMASAYAKLNVHSKDELRDLVGL